MTWYLWNMLGSLLPFCLIYCMVQFINIVAVPRNEDELPPLHSMRWIRAFYQLHYALVLCMHLIEGRPWICNLFYYKPDDLMNLINLMYMFLQSIRVYIWSLQRLMLYDTISYFQFTHSIFNIFFISHSRQVSNLQVPKSFPFRYWNIVEFSRMSTSKHPVTIDLEQTINTNI